MSLFLGFLFLSIIIAWTAVATYKTARNKKKEYATCGVFGIAIFSLFFYINFYNAFSKGKAASLETNTAYMLVNTYTSVGEVVLELRTAWTGAGERYFYLVPCSSLRDGCREKWPSVFATVKDGEKLVIVPLSPVITGEKD